MINHRERLNEVGLDNKSSYAIVRSYGNKNHKRLAEMTNLLLVCRITKCTSPIPRVFQLGLVGNLAAQFVILKFGAVVAKGAGYGHSAIKTTR